MYLEIKELNKVLGNNDILVDINLSFEKGKIYGLKGKNGSGKTMLMRAICGLIRPTKGSVSIDGKLLGKELSFPPSLGLLLENPSFLPEYTGFENLKIISNIKKVCTDEQIKESIKKVNLDPEDKRTYKKYSLGMKQRLGIACAIMEEPELIILDEPTNALDEKGVLELRNTLFELRDAGKLIILSCHDTEELNLLCDEVIHMENGKVKGITQLERQTLEKNDGDKIDK